jgi:hypothetical protein
MVTNFPNTIEKFLNPLPKNDYPVLDTHLFVSCWLGWVLDKSLVSMRDLIFRLQSRGLHLDLSTFSKASRSRDPSVFENLLQQIIKELKKQKGPKEFQSLFPLDSTIVTLTTKLMWCQGFHQVKLFCGWDRCYGSVEGVDVHFGQGHDNKYGEATLKQIPENSIAIMDRGFASKKRIQDFNKKQKRSFVLRTNKNLTLTMLENGDFLLGTGKETVATRLVWFCDLEIREEFRLATNLPAEEITNAEIGEIYRQRWQIELLWKFLKMHLKLDRLITKNPNGIRIQIYSCLIAYLLLQLVQIPSGFGQKMLDKLRYLQAQMCEKISYIHWFRQIAYQL